MKKLCIVLLCLLTAKVALAQKELLAFDEHNKYIYYQVVDQPGLSADTLADRGHYFLKSAYPKLSLNKGTENTSISGRGEMPILSGLGIVKSVDGNISYTYTIECKDQKYRFWLTDFVYTPYKIDRYGNSVPELGIEIPLEAGTAKLDKRQLESYLNQTAVYCKKFGEELKGYMIKISASAPKDPKKKVISTKEW